MNKKKLAFCMGMALASFFTTNSFAAASPGNGSGVVHFTGVIQDVTCKVKSGDEDQIVNLGTVSKAELGSVGKSTAGVRFTIHLTDCPATVSKNSKVALRFDGIQDKINSDLLAVSSIVSPSATPASGVAIALYNEKSNKALPLFTDSEQETISYTTPGTSTSGYATFDFLAKYVATAAVVTSGAADADAFFTIAYD